MMKWVMTIKLIIINILIVVFAYLLWDLMKQALREHDSVVVGIVAGTLGTPIIGLLSLEIHLIYKHIMEMLKHKHRIEEK